MAGPVAATSLCSSSWDLLAAEASEAQGPMPYRRLYGRAGEVPYPVLVMGATNSGGKVLCDTDSECSATQALPCRVLDRYHPSVIVSVPSDSSRPDLHQLPAGGDRLPGRLAVRPAR